MEKKSSWFLYFSTLSVNLIGFACGIVWAWSSAVVPKLNGSAGPENNPLYQPTTVFEESWIVSMTNLGASAGPLMSAYLANKIGRKKTMLYFSLPLVLAHVIVIFASTVYELCIARFLMGISVGCMSTLIPIYVAEIAETDNRGFFGVFFFLSLTSGNTAVFALCPYITVSTLSLLSLVPSVLFLFIFGIFIPDSPYYHVLVDDIHEAENVLKKLRRSTNVQKELVEIQTAVEASKLMGNPGVKELFTNKITFKALLIGLGLVVAQQGTAITPVFLYLQPIFDSTGSSIKGDTTALVVASISFLTCVGTLKAIELVNKKTLLLASEILIFLTLVTLGVFFYLKDHGYDTTPIFWLPIVCMMLYIVGYNFGMGPVVYQYLSEIFPTNIKSLAGTVCISFNIALSFLLSALFPFMSLYLSMSVSLWFFAITAAIGMVFITKFVPETKGKTFLEIQDDIKRGNKTVNKCDIINGEV